VILGGLVGITAIFIPKEYLSPTLPFLFFFFIAVTLLSYFFLLRTMKKKINRFINTYLLVTFLKLMVYILVMITYVFTNRSDAIPFMLGFFILYLCYTIFEVVLIVGKTRKPESGTSTQ
jgi:uncharacterized membrane protein YoaK (UPF0700 family)